MSALARPLSVVVIDNDENVHRSLQALPLSHPAVVRIVTVAASVDELDDGPPPQPDVVVLDFWLGRDCRSSVDDVVRLAQWNAPIVLYTSEERPYLIQTAVTAGITALCLKHDGLDALVRTLASIRDGELRPSRQLAAALADLPPLRARLTPTEATVLRGLAYGLSASEIATRLCVSVDTVRCHTKHIHEKYRAVLGDGPVNRQQTLRAALEDGYWDAREWGAPWNIP